MQQFDPLYGWYDDEQGSVAGTTPQAGTGPLAPAPGTPGLSYTPGTPAFTPEGGSSIPPPVDTATGGYPAGWGQGDGGLWYFDEPAPGPSGPSVGSAGPSGWSFPGFEAPSWDLKPWAAPAPFNYDEFVGPTSETFTADPGYEFRKRQGELAMSNGMSATGLARGGPMLKALADYNQGLASQEFKNVWDRGARTWEMNRNNAADIYDRNAKNSLAKWGTDFQLESGEFDRSLRGYGANADTSYRSAALNQAGQNDLFRNLLSLYDMSTRTLPTYSQITQPSSSYGYNY